MLLVIMTVFAAFLFLALGLIKAFAPEANIIGVDTGVTILYCVACFILFVQSAFFTFVFLLVAE